LSLSVESRGTVVVQRVKVVSPRGFCAGVVRAIATVEHALAIFPHPVFVRRAIVHNADVVAGLEAGGATFVEEIDDVPRGSVVVLSAHGVPASVYERARVRGLQVVDATCPLVAKVHREVRRFSQMGLEVLVIGNAGHEEVAGTLGQAPGVRLVEPGSDVSRLSVANPDRVACVTQTTLSPQFIAPTINKLRERFPALVEPAVSDICFATRNRQEAIERLAPEVDVVFIVGDRTSSNSRRLRERAQAHGTSAHLIGSLAELDDRWLAEVEVVGVSAGASTPEHLVAEVVDHFRRQGAVVQEAAFLDERVSFGLPSTPGKRFDRLRMDVATKN
jgi:4-hydroxy-3-methylbut-2-en-1-yl diphosphate reductase